MKIVCIYGNDELKAKSRMLDIVKGVKKKQWQVQYVTAALSKNLRLNSLFEDNILFVCENPMKLTDADWEWLSKNNSESDASFLLLFKSTVPAKVKKLLPKDTKYEEFKVSQSVFAFIDAFYPGNAKRALALLKQTTATEPLELVFALLARQIRDLYWTMVSPETFSAPDWKASKVKTLAKKFGEEKLKRLINSLATADMDAKTSQTPLEISLDRIIVKELS